MPGPYQPMTLVRLAVLLATGDDTRRWRLVAEFLEEYRWEPPEVRVALLAEEPAGTGDERWDVFLAALAEHLSARETAAHRRGRTPDRCDSSGFRSTRGRRGSTRWCTHPPPFAVGVSSWRRRNSRSHEHRRSAARPGGNHRRVPSPGRSPCPAWCGGRPLRVRRGRDGARVRRAPGHPGHRRGVPTVSRSSSIASGWGAWPRCWRCARRCSRMSRCRTVGEGLRSVLAYAAARPWPAGMLPSSLVVMPLRRRDVLGIRRSLAGSGRSGRLCRCRRVGRVGGPLLRVAGRR